MLSCWGNGQRDVSDPPKAVSTTWSDGHRSNDKFTVVVGRGHSEFVVDAEVLSPGNDYFVARFVKALTETNERILLLPSIKTEVFRAYMQWAYARKVVVMGPGRAHQSRNKSEEQIKLSDLYDFVYYITDVGLQNAITDAFLDTLRTAFAPTPATISRLWRGQDDAPLHNVVGQWFVAKPNAVGYLKQRQYQIPTDFFIELALVYAAIAFETRPPEPCAINRSSFHKHTDAAPPRRYIQQRTQLTQENLSSVGDPDGDRRRSSGSRTFGRGTRSEMKLRICSAEEILALLSTILIP